jgi:FMN phosphatase YigB (HAD superfamily)
VINDLQISPQEILHVGDTLEEDIIGAHQANIRAVFIDRLGKNVSLPDHTTLISSLNHLLD